MRVDSSYFHSIATGFFYTGYKILTNKRISKENVDSYSFSHKTIFSINSDNQISLLAYIKAIPNLECKFIWKDDTNNIIQEYTGDVSGSHHYFIWDDLKGDKIKCGDFNVSLLLNNIRQFKIYFKIRGD